MGIDNNKNKEQTLSAQQILDLLYDDGIYTEIAPQLYSEDVEAEAVAAFGEVGGQSIYSFVQCTDRFDGAMSIAQANKLLKLYSLALKTGCPVVGFYKSSTGRIMQGNMLLDVLSELLGASSQLSGVVPQISVILGECVSSTALLAANADFIVKTESAKISISDSCCNGAKSSAIIAKNDSEAVEAVVDLLSFLPANNLALAPVADFSEVACTDFDSIFDSDSKLDLFDGTFDEVQISLRRLEGIPVGTVKTCGKLMSSKAAKRIASFVRFCDAFSIPVITAVDSEGFECLGGAKALLSAYAEATTPKLSVITGSAVGITYLALAGKGSGADAVIGISGSTISPIAPKAAAYVALSGELTGTFKEQDEQLDNYVKTQLSAENAAKQGFIDDISDYQNLRIKLVNYLNILSGKRVETLPKKHPTI